MEHLPQNDMPMLASAINFLLRDEEFDNLDQICDYYHEDRAELEKKLAEAGFHTRKSRNALSRLKSK